MMTISQTKARLAEEVMPFLAAILNLYFYLANYLAVFLVATVLVTVAFLTGAFLAGVLT